MAPSVMTNFNPASNIESVKIIDSRPEKEKVSEVLTRTITSCNYWIWRIGDEQTTPNKITFLKNNLANTLGDSVNQKEFTIKKYDIFFNGQNNARGNARNGMALGIISGLVIDELEKVGSNCPKEEMDGGWYDAKEITNNNSPIIIEILLTVDGHDHFARYVYSPSEMYIDLASTKATNELFNAMDSANNMIIKSILASNK
jgi:hypothetical protein